MKNKKVKNKNIMPLYLEKRGSVSSEDSESCETALNSIGNDYHNNATSQRIKRIRANDRERRRVHLINCAMESLRKVIPGMREKRKSTKLELLRAANHYIWLLDESLRSNKPLDEVMARSIEPPSVYYVLPYQMHPEIKNESHY